MQDPVAWLTVPNTLEAQEEAHVTVFGHVQGWRFDLEMQIQAVKDYPAHAGLTATSISLCQQLPETLQAPDMDRRNFAMLKQSQACLR